MGGINTDCKKCKCKRVIAETIRKFYKALTTRPLHKYSVGLAVATFIIYLLFNVTHSETYKISTLLSLIGLIFAALKFKLDEAHYQKSLFEDRYKLFCIIEKLMYKANTLKIDDNDLRIFDEIINKCQFLFGKTTLIFILDVRSRLIKLIYFNKSNINQGEDLDQTMEFFSSLLTLKTLAGKFPELMINNY